MRKKLGISMALLLGAATASHAADLPTMKPAPTPVPAAVNSCTDPIQFVTTACPLTWYGITLYGTVDVGVGWEEHGAKFSNYFPTGVTEFVQKYSNHAQWLFTPNGLSQSNIGIKGKEEFAPGWSFVFDLNMGFDPYSLQLANGPRSQLANNGVPTALQGTNGDSARAGQFYNGAGNAGISSTTFGTLVVGRVNSLTLDGVNSYDPMGGSYAFSPIGWSGATAGVGDTEDTRYSTAIKYKVDVGMFRAAGLYQFGGYDLNNASKDAYQLSVGADFDGGAYGKLSLDAIYSRDTDAVSIGVLSAAQNLKYPGTQTATISDDTSVMVLAKYTWNQFKIMGGYEHITFQNPSDRQTTSFDDISGYTVVAADVTNTAYTNHKILQVMWIGGRYAYNDALDFGAAFYHYIQDSYAAKHCDNESSGTCAGTMNAVSVDVDWKFSAKFDAYAGMLFSEVHGGLASGYVHSANFAPTAGVRFRF